MKCQTLELVNPCGNGDSTEKIVDAYLERYFNNSLEWIVPDYTKSYV